MGRHYDNYWLAFEPEELERHARLTAKADAENQLLVLETSTNAFRAITEIILYTPDNAGLVLAIRRRHRHGGRFDRGRQGLHHLRRFRAGRIFGAGRRRRGLQRSRAAGPPAPDHRKDPARRDPPAPRAAPARCSAAAPAHSASGPKCHFDNEASRIATVIEVECLDRPGLLYDITQAFFEAGLSISTSMVATYGERAIDVFYVRDGFGHKIVTYRARLEAVEQRLMAALSPAPLEAAYVRQGIRPL